MSKQPSIRYSKPYIDGKEWAVDLFTIRGNEYLETLEFKSKELALLYIKDKIMKDEDKEKAKDSIKDLFALEAAKLPVESPTDSDLPARLELPTLDYVDVKDKSVIKGKKLMNSLLKLYLSKDIIENNEYIQLKAQVDQMTLSSLIFQMQTAEHALTTLLRTIDSGELGPRMFEVLGGLQKTMLDIMKHQTLHLHAMEEGAKKLKHDIDIYTTDKELEETNTKNNIPKGPKSPKRGARNLMREVQAEITEEKSEDVDFEELPEKDDK